MLTTIFSRPVMLLAITTLATGCGVSGMSGTSTSGTSWANASNNSIPGIDSGDVSRITLWAGDADGVTFVLWADSPNTIGASNGNGAPGRSTFTSQLTVPTQASVPLVAKTTFGNTGGIQIGDVSYDFKDGTVFLISTQSGKLQILQTTLDANNLSTDSDDLAELGRTTPQILEFFEQHKPAGESN